MLQYAIILIIIGIAADNLMIAGLSGNGFSAIRSQKWFIIILMLFIIQNEMLIWGKWISQLTLPLVNNHKEWFALGLLASMAVNICKELRVANRKPISIITYTADNILMLAFATAMYVFVFGIAMQWLNMTDYRINIFLFGSILLFLSVGLLLGKFHCNKLIKIIHTICAGLLLVGVVILFFQII